MSHATPSEEDVVNTLSSLKLSTKSPQKPVAKPKSAPVAESWDDDLSSGSDTETEADSSTLSPNSTNPTSTGLSPLSTLSSISPPVPPPPTPASPTPFEFPSAAEGGWGQRQTGSRDGSRGGSGTTSPVRRPDKTTAVAGRLIAGALGVRPPKRTEEEREYDRKMREKERKRRDVEREKEKAEQDAAELRKKAIWDD